jgi:hypothetical protein
MTQITEVKDWNVQCGDVVTITLRGHSSYMDTIAFNGFTRSVTVQAPCCDCGEDPCADLGATDIQALVDAFIEKLRFAAPGNNPDNLSLNSFYTFERVGTGAASILRITGKPLTKYGVPCDIAAFPWEYDRMWFRTFVYEGPATTADFIVADNCNIVANAVIMQRSSYPTGTAAEIRQLEINHHSYQAGYLKHLYRMAGYNGNFESYVVDGLVYDTYYIKFKEYDKNSWQWGDFMETDYAVILAVPAVVNSPDVPAEALIATVDAFFAAAFGVTITDPTVTLNADCVTTTSTTTAVAPSTTTTTSTLIP